ncbi:MAG: type II toxin-antitoxin system RelE/ParE family toxin [Bacteroidetes bacterium]|nr:type II toxin-antitoxin system RelE/ParE family toxin [Bacteroidota bacterium]
MFTVVFSPDAITDVEEAVAYYESKQIEVTNQFIAHLQTTLNAIRRNPYFASIRYDSIRCAQVKKFPFLVHYHIDETNSIVSILAVYSTHQEPLG